jgi:hypothetical protein
MTPTISKATVEVPRSDLVGIRNRLRDALAKIQVYLDLQPDAEYIPEGATFAYTNSRGRTYYLHGRTTMLKSGKQQTIYFFSKELRSGALGAIPAGYVVYESKNGLPVLKVG